MENLRDALEAIRLERLVPENGKAIHLVAIWFDRSESMERYGGSCLKTLNSLLRQYGNSPDVKRTHLMVVSSYDKHALLAPLSPAHETPRFLNLPCHGSTGLYQSLECILQYLFMAEDHLETKGIKTKISVMVMTDGVDNLSPPESQVEVMELAAKAQSRGWSLLTYGFGTEASEIALRLGFPREPELLQTFGRLYPAFMELTGGTTFGWPLIE